MTTAAVTRTAIATVDATGREFVTIVHPSAERSDPDPETRRLHVDAETTLYEAGWIVVGDWIILTGSTLICTVTPR